MKKSRIFSSVAAALAITAAAPASAMVIGGINFGSTDVTHLETATLAQQIVTGNGQNSIAYGQISTVNGTRDYCGAAGDDSCTLYYIAEFTGSQNFTTGYLEFTGATVTLYYSPNPDVNLLSQNSTQNLDFIDNFSVWGQLSGHNNLGGIAAANAVANATGQFAGSTLTSTGNGLLDVVDGVGFAGVATHLDTNTIADAAGGFADIAFTSSANNFVLNPFDRTSTLADHCGKTGQQPGLQAGDWCFQGTSNIRGEIAQIPEPGTVALLGLGLAGMLGFSRKK